MKILEPGHVYELDLLDIETEQPDPVIVRFVNREPGHEHSGTQAQDVLRMLVDRTAHCHACLPDPINEKIIYHLEMALVCHEARALLRKAEKGLYRPSEIGTNKADGHFLIHPVIPPPEAAPRLSKLAWPPASQCTYREDY